MKKPFAVRATGAVLKDVRSAVVAFVIVAGIGSSVVRHDHVKVRAWVAVLAAAGVVALVVFLEWRRFRVAQRSVRLEGALAEARLRASQAEAKQRPNAAAEETLRLIRALRATLTRHAEPYGVPTTVTATEDEIMRSTDLVERVRVLVGTMDSRTANLLDQFAPSTQKQGRPSVGKLLSGLDHMEALVANWGLRDEDSVPAPGPSGLDVITTPTHTVMVDKRGGSGPPRG